MDGERHEAQQIGRRLREQRERRGMSRLDVTRLTGLSKRNIEWIESHGVPQLARLANLADLYGICPGELFGAVCGEDEA